MTYPTIDPEVKFLLSWQLFVYFKNGGKFKRPMSQLSQASKVLYKLSQDQDDLFLEDLNYIYGTGPKRPQT